MMPAQLGRLCKQALVNQNPYLPAGGRAPQAPSFQPSFQAPGAPTGPSLAGPPKPKPGWLSSLGSTLTSPFRTHEANPGAWKQTPRGVENNWWSAGRGALDAASYATANPWAIGGSMLAGSGSEMLQDKYAPQPEATKNDWWAYNPERFRHEQGYGPEQGAQNTWHAALGRTLGRTIGAGIPGMAVGDTRSARTNFSLLSHPVRAIANTLPMAWSRPIEQAKAWWNKKPLPYSPAEIIDPLFTRQ